MSDSAGLRGTGGVLEADKAEQGTHNESSDEVGECKQGVVAALVSNFRHRVHRELKQSRQ